MDEALKDILDRLAEESTAAALANDPLELVKRYGRPEDAEIVGLIAAAFALGRIGPMRRAIERVLEPMGASPYTFIRRYDPRDNADLYEGFRYRFYNERDLHLLLWWIKAMVIRAGCVKVFFLQGLERESPDITISLSRFVRAVLALPTEPVYGSPPVKGSGVRHFLADPFDGSGCKRLNLFLRWMVRRKDPDLGIWREIDPSRLIIPLDTHIVRLGYRLELTRRRSPGWAMASEITRNLSLFDPSDPVKYDFALCHACMHRPCPPEPGPGICRSCPLVSKCRSVRMGACT